MIRECIIFVILIFVFITKGTNAVSNQNLSLYGTREHRKTIHKCCPFGQYIDLNKSCVTYNGTFTFNEIEVYSDNMEKTGKTVKDMFTLLPGRFVDKQFKKNATDPIVFVIYKFNVYIVESGTLLLEMPNKYNRWTPIANDNFCVDYKIQKKNQSTIGIWTVLNNIDQEEYNEYYTYTLLVSCFFMLLVLIVYGLLPELQNLAGMILMAYVTSLFLAFLLLTVIHIKQHSSLICIILTLGIYFFFLASICWMNVMSYDIWWTFRSNYSSRRSLHSERVKFLKYCIYAWGVPLAMTIVLAVLNSVDMRHVPWFVTPNVPKDSCFLSGGSRLLYMYIPTVILILCNWLFYLMTALNIWQGYRHLNVVMNDAAGNRHAHNTNTQRLTLYLKLSVVMGLNWLLEIVSYFYPGLKILWYISDVYNILTGFAIFLIFVCKKNIYKKLGKRILDIKERTRGSKNSSTTVQFSLETVSLQSKVSSNPRGTNNTQ